MIERLTTSELNDLERRCVNAERVKLDYIPIDVRQLRALLEAELELERAIIQGVKP